LHLVLRLRGGGLAWLFFENMFLFSFAAYVALGGYGFHNHLHEYGSLGFLS
jgi:hypothetical protein